MIKVKTFSSPLKVFQARKELEGLDQTLNQFITEHNIARIYSVSDTCTTDNTGATIGLIRVIAYDE